MTKLEELKAAWDAAYGADCADYPAWAASAASAASAYQAELKRIQEENSND